MGKCASFLILTFLLISFGCSENTATEPIATPTTVLPYTPKSTPETIIRTAEETKPESTSSPTLTASEEPSPTASSTPTLEPTSTDEPATETVQPPTLEPTPSPPPLEPTLPPPRIEPTSSPPPPIETSTSNAPRKTGDIWFEAGNRWIDLCPESAPKLNPHYVNNRPIETYDLHTYVVSVNGNLLTVYNDSGIGGITLLPISEYRIIRQGSYNKETVSSSDFEPSDCVFVSNVIVDNQLMPGPFVVSRAADN